MPTTLALLEKALSTKRASIWARELNLDRSAIAQAKKRGRLSPTMAGALAVHMAEDPIKWTAIAAVEAEPESPLRAQLVKALEKAWRHS